MVGLKPGQRKVLFTAFKKYEKKEIKVAQMAGAVAEMSAYHHGEVKLTIDKKTKMMNCFNRT